MEIHKQVDDVTGENMQHDETKDAVEANHEKAGAQPHVDTFRFSRPVVLSAICGHGDTHAFQRTHEEHFDAHAGGEGGHARRTQGVVCALEHDASDSGDRELQSHRYAHVQQSLYVVFVQGGFSLFHFQDVEFPEHIIQAKQGGDGLREDRGDGGSGHAPM